MWSGLIKTLVGPIDGGDIPDVASCADQYAIAGHIVWPYLKPQIVRLF